MMTEHSYEGTLEYIMQVAISDEAFVPHAKIISERGLDEC